MYPNVRHLRFFEQKGANFIGFGAGFAKKSIAVGQGSKKSHANLFGFGAGRIKRHINKGYICFFIPL